MWIELRLSIYWDKYLNIHIYVVGRQVDVCVEEVEAQNPYIIFKWLIKFHDVADYYLPTKYIRGF